MPRHLLQIDVGVLLPIVPNAAKNCYIQQVHFFFTIPQFYKSEYIKADLIEVVETRNLWVSEISTSQHIIAAVSAVQMILIIAKYALLHMKFFWIVVGKENAVADLKNLIIP